jgi:hypothetical protein
MRKTKTMTSKKDAFFALASRPLRSTQVMVEGEVFTLRELSEADASEMEVAMQTKDGKFDFARHRMLLVTYSLVDDDGKRIVDNWEQLKAFPRSIIGRLYEACLELSKYDEKEIRDLSKKSGEAES